MKLRDATAEEIRASGRGGRSRNPERDATFADAVAKAKRGKAQVFELTSGEKAVTIRAAANAYLKRNDIVGVRVRALGPDRFLIEQVDRPNART